MKKTIGWILLGIFTIGVLALICFAVEWDFKLVALIVGGIIGMSGLFILGIKLIAES